MSFEKKWCDEFNYRLILREKKQRKRNFLILSSMIFLFFVFGMSLTLNAQLRTIDQLPGISSSDIDSFNDVLPIVDVSVNQTKKITPLQITKFMNHISVTESYDITSSDQVIYASSSGPTYSITFPAASANNKRILILKKTDSTNIPILLTGTGLSDNYLITNSEAVMYQSNGSNWVSLWRKTDTPWISFTPTGQFSGDSTYTGMYRRSGNSVEFQMSNQINTNSGSGSLGFNYPFGWSLSMPQILNASAQNCGLGQSTSILSNFAGSSTNSLVGFLCRESSFIIRPTVFRVSGDLTQRVALSANSPVNVVSGDIIRVWTIPLPINNMSP